MADQIEFQMPRRVLAEGTGFTLPVKFRDRAQATGSTPTTIHYRVDCLTTGQTLLDWTSVSPSSGVNLTMLPGFSAIRDDLNDFERKQVTVKADDGLSTQCVKAASWEVENLFGSP